MILPPIILIIGLIFLLAAKLIQEEPNKRIALNIGLAPVLFFNALNYFVLYVQANAIKDIGKFGFNRFLLLAFAWPELFAMVGVLIAVVIVNVIYSYIAAKNG